MRLFRRSNVGVESEAALEDAKRNLLQVQRRGSEVSAVSEALVEIRERNHFAENLEAILLTKNGGLIK